MKKKILIVEDEQRLIKQYSQVLREFGEILQATNSEEAFSIIHEGIDLIILDNKLTGDPRFPQEDAGTGILKVIKSELKLEVPVVIITAYPKKEEGIIDGQEAISIGAYDYLEKPIDLFELKKVAHKALFGD